MAKRKRLTPARPAPLPSDPPQNSAVATRAPIAQVAGEASANAALSELSDTLRQARAEGRMIETLPLTAIDDSHLMRDRMVQDQDEMAALMASLDARGQQTPIEVVPLSEPRDGLTHGLISGWRRLSALRQLRARTAEARFATVQARVIAPVDVQAAYVAMVEENEIRAGISLYEKARIALRAVHEGVYPTERAALRGLFGSISRSRRSKIGSFIPLVEQLEALLQFPAAIPEKLGLALSKALQEDHVFATALKLALRSKEHDSAEAELALLNRVLRDGPRMKARTVAKDPAPRLTPSAPRAPGHGPRVTGTDPEAVARRLAATRVEARLEADAGRIILTGGGVDADLLTELKAWLKARRS